MELSTRLDVDLVAVESADELTLLVELTAPVPTTSEPRQPATLQIVLDRSGSMGGERLEGARRALLALVDRLDPMDNLGIVAFDDEVQVVVPAGPLTDKASVKAAIAGIHAGGSTDLSAGYLRGLQEARRVAGPTGATLLLISDGHANAGVRDPDVLGRLAAEAHTNSVTTSTVGFGLGYDETLLAALAKGGSGNELFAEEADTAVALISGEVTGLLEQVGQAASLRVRWTDKVAGAQVLNDLACAKMPDGFVVELGSFYAGESRRLLIKLQVPSIPALGLCEVAKLELTYVSLPDLVQHTKSMPLYVNVVPGDQAAGRIRDPEVHSEALFQESQQVKRESSRLLTQGRVAEATKLLKQTSARLMDESGTLPIALQAELNREAGQMEALAEEAAYDVARAAKVSSMSSTLGSRNRGRRNRGGTYTLTWATGADLAPEATLVLEEWELVRLKRMLPPELASPLRSSTSVRSEADALAVARELGDGHPHAAFFAGASAHGGFLVARA